MSPEVDYKQSGVIPYRIKKEQIEILLITSRSGKRMVIPKGLIEFNLSPLDSALKEAYEEAGISGSPHKKPLGRYQYKKWGGICEVEVFLLCVEEISGHWPEDDFRERYWFSLDEAASRVKEDRLKRFILSLPKKI